jgi:exodeoxyribonuclease V alpha subunit
MISDAWEEQKEIREVMLFLQTHGVSSGYATKIFKQYGEQSIDVVKQNPYRLATDIFGIGFVTADGIAQRLGFSKHSELRAEAGILYVLEQLAEDGHVYYPYQPLIRRCQDVLGVERDVVVGAFAAVAGDKRIVIEALNASADEFRDDNIAVYLARYHVCETSIATRLNTLAQQPKSIRKIDAEKAVEWVQRQLDITLAAAQIEAIRRVVENKIMVITGGPGTGKTTIIHAILKIFSKLGSRIMLAAPTGRAAKRMVETTGHEAKTIHRLLSYSMHHGGFQKNEKKPLNCDLLIVDEASMIDTVLMHHLVKAVPLKATLVLVGDVNQLPSVGAGNVLKDIISSAFVPTVKLNDIFRQAKESLIVVNAHRINNGRMPLLEANGSKDDFFFIEQADPEAVLDIILELAKERIPKRFGFDPVADIQVLTPMNKGTVGAVNLNNELQKSLNPGPDDIVRGDRVYRRNDKVMQLRNNYDKDVFNGDIGRIEHIDRAEQRLTVAIYDRHVAYEYSDLDEIVLAYAVSVHKSQGSEYPAVIIPVLAQHYVLLQRNLIYTAITRGRRLVVMIGSRNAVAMAIHNDRPRKRFTHLRHRLSF